MNLYFINRLDKDTLTYSIWTAHLTSLGKVSCRLEAFICLDFCDSFGSLLKQPGAAGMFQKLMECMTPTKEGKKKRHSNVKKLICWEVVIEGMMHMCMYLV